MLKSMPFAAVLCFLLSSFAFAPGEEALKPAEHQALGKLIGDYFEARDKNKGIDKAEVAVTAELEKLGKKLKRDPLSLTNDLGRALWIARGYEKISVKKGKVLAMELPGSEDKDKKDRPQFAVYSPEKYNPKQAYPLILTIPDKGEKTTDHLTERWTSQSIREGAILAAVPMPEDAAMWTEMGTAESAGGGGNVLRVLREVSAQYAVDFDRIYISGRGEGVAAALMLAARFPYRFAGVIGRTGDAGDAPAENLQNLPTFFAGAGAKATAFAEKIDKLGYKNCTLKADGSEDDIWTWIQANPRASIPASITLFPSEKQPLMAYWLDVPPSEYKFGEHYLKATADRGSNTITIDAEGVQRVTIYFNDLIVDLDKPVKVVCNGAETISTIARGTQKFLDLSYSTKSDPGRPFTMTKQFDIPEKPKKKN